MENFIRVYDGVLSPGFCADVIRRFDASENKFAGEVIAVDGQSVVNREQKRTTELVITDDAAWADIERELQIRYVECVNRYAEEFPHLSGLSGNLYSEVFRLKKYDKDGFFNWHIDCSGENFNRVLAIQYYFNDVGEGGATEFRFQDTKVESVQGRVVMFPTLWTYYHRGAAALSNPKYSCTNFVKIDPAQRS